MKNNGLFSSLFIDELKDSVKLDDAAQGRMVTLAQTWRTLNTQDTEALWESFLKQALSYLEFVPPGNPTAPGVYPLYEDWGFTDCISVLYLAPPGSDIDNTSVGSFYPAKLLAQLKERKLNWGILTDGASWRLYSTKSSRPYEDYVELPLEQALEGSDEAEYGLFERFFHKDSFIAEETEGTESGQQDESVGIYKCRLDHDRDQSEQVLEEWVKKPFLAQVDEVLQYICNGFIFDTQKSGEGYTEEERAEIFESAVKLIYRCLFLFYAEARRLLPTDPEKADLYRRHSIQALCLEARKFRWGQRRDTEQYDLWKHLKGLINAVNDGDSEYGIMGYNGGLFDDDEERFLGQHQLRNDFLSRALYLLKFVEPYDNELDNEYPIPYEDLEVRHLGELYENILEYTVQLAEADRIRRRTKKGVEMLLASQTTKKAGDTLIKKGDVYFGESALERKQTGSYYTPESLVRFLNEKTIIHPLHEIFERKYRQRFNDLLEQASNGHDIGTRRGAAQSAAALVERFAEDELLKFKVCDLAMGSGHFLVDAANQMAGLLIALLAEVPHVEGMMVSVTSRPNDWRRRITRHCIYGVDLNPLAVNLAKLSLWLNCFAIEHKLTFLDHHVRCGNSLIGIRSLDQLTSIPERKKGNKKKDNQTGDLFPDFQQYASVLAQAGQDVQSISAMDEDETDIQKSVFDNAQQKVSALKPLADLYTSYLMDGGIRPDDYHALFYSLAKKQKTQNSLNPDLPKILESLDSYQSRHHFFHWPLEFPDVFGTDAMGVFSANIGNPPWNIVKPNSQEFFSDYDPKFRSYKKQEANRVSKKLMADNPAIAEKWEEYCDGFAEQSTYFREPLSYSALGKGDINTFKLFLEQFFTVLGDGGRMGIVVPSGIYTDQGCQLLRERFFNRSRVELLYCFENRRAVFNIHRSFKFVLFGTQKSGSTDRFKCAFMEHDPERLPLIEKSALKISRSLVLSLSPKDMLIFELRNQKQSDILEHIYSSYPRFGSDDGWNIKFTREINNTSHIDLLNQNEQGAVLHEGKMIHQFKDDYSTNIYWIDDDKARELLRKKGETRTLDVDFFRIANRRQARSTDERAMIATIITPGHFAWDNMAVNRVEPLKTRDTYLSDICFIIGVMNSMVFDFILGLQINSNLSFFIIYSLPVPFCRPGDTFYDVIVSRVSRLVSNRNDFSSLWSSVFSNDWQPPTFWYPSSAPIDTYGPAHEQEIRRRLRDEAKNLTSEWGPHCGVHDRLPDRRDTGDRAQLRAEIDAYVAHLYGLSRDDFAYILDTFPVLKKKEKKAFGEFMSKRKCLEEYDRIKTIMNAE
jgi:hypothetical protein